MSIKSITARAREGTLEVEHLLKEARHPDAALADALDALRTELQWSSSGALEDGRRVVPLAAWARVVSAYARDGHPGLLALSADPGLADFVIGLLEELKTKEALDTLLLAFHAQLGAPERDVARASRIASALNLMLTFKPAVAVEPLQAQRLRTFLHALYACAESEAQRAGALLALRGVGDEHSAGFAMAQRLEQPWQDVPGIVARHIRKAGRAASA